VRFLWVGKPEVELDSIGGAGGFMVDVGERSLMSPTPLNEGTLVGRFSVGSCSSSDERSISKREPVRAIVRACARGL
jgi:hypothetical protein